LWSRLKGGQINGYKFRRQHGIGKYIVDLYCPKAKLVIEVDGDSHYQKDGQGRDNQRDEYLRNLGLRVLRFTNEEIMENINGVVEEIINVLNVTTPAPSLGRLGTGS
jgi:very-short-patch-repair endonuclease